MHNFSSPSEIVGRMPGASSAVNLGALMVKGRPVMKVHSEGNTCMGCIGRYDGSMCSALPSECVKESIIWVPAESPLQQYYAALEQDIG